MRQRHHVNVMIDDDLDSFATVSGDVDLGDDKSQPEESPSIENMHVMVEIEGVEFEVTSLVPGELKERLEQRLYEFVYESLDDTTDMEHEEEDDSFTY